MKREPHMPSDRPGDYPERVDHPLFEDLSRPLPAPDLTRPIMGRLGYMKVSEKRSRQLRLRRWASRAGLTCAAAVAIAMGWKMYLDGPEIRRPSGPTIPSAIGHDVIRQQRNIGAVLQTIRNLSPRVEPSDDQSQPAREPDEAPPPNDDVNQSTIAPVRWV